MPAAIGRARGHATSGPVATGLLAIGAAILAAGTVAASPTNPLLPVVLIAGVAALAVAIAQPLALVALGVVAIPLEGFFPGLVGPSQAILGLAVVGWFVHLGASSPVTLPRHPALAAFALLVLAQAAGLLFAPEPLVVARQTIAWGALFLVAVLIAREASERQLAQLLYAFAICGGVAGLVAVIDPQPLTAVVFQGSDVNRATGGLGSPNALGMLLGLTIPVQLVFCLRGTSLSRLVAAVCFGLAMLGMAFAVSRGAFIGLGASMLVLAFWRPFRNAAVLLVPIVVVLSLIGHNPASPIGTRVVERLSEATTTASENPRLILWRAAPQMIEDRPVFGLGALEYGYYGPEYRLRLTEGIANHAHNLLLTIVIESGIVGLAAMVSLLGFVGAGLRRVIRYGSGLSHALGWALAATFVGFLANGVLDYGLGAAPIGSAFFGLIGCAIGLSLRAGRPAGTSRNAAQAARPPGTGPTGRPSSAITGRA